MPAYQSLSLNASQRREELNKSAYANYATPPTAFKGGQPAATQPRSYMQRKLLDPMWNAGSGGLKSIGDDVNQTVDSAAKSVTAGVHNAVDQGFDKSLDFVNRNISAPMQGAYAGAKGAVQSQVAGVHNAVDQGFDKSLDFVNRNISAPMQGALSGGAAAYQAANPSPAPVTAPAQAAPVAANPAPAAPVAATTPDYNTMFRQTHGGAFDPNSSMDRQKMQQLQQVKSASAQELWTSVKSASKMGLIKSLAGGADDAAKGGMKLLNGGVDDALSAVSKNVDEAADTMRTVKGKATTVGGSPPAGGGGGSSIPYGDGGGAPVKTFKNYLSDGLKGRVKPIAQGASLVGAGALSHSMGSSSGKKEGLELGGAQGFDAGLQAGSQQASMDPGVLGRLMEVFTGRQGGGVDPASAEMSARRDAVLKQILAGGSGIKSASAKSSGTKKLLAALGIGGVGGGVGGGVVGHGLGHSSGFEDGAGQGYDAGLTAPPAGPSVDPGAAQRLLEVFTGRQDTEKSLRDVNVGRVVRGELVNGKPVAKSGQ